MSCCRSGWQKRKFKNHWWWCWPLTVHQDQVVVLAAEHLQRNQAVFGHIGNLPDIFQHGQGDFLIDRLVFGKQDAATRVVGAQNIARTGKAQQFAG